MSVTYRTSLKDTRMNAVNADIGASGLLVIGTSALSGATGVLATVPCAASAFGASSSGTITLAGVPLTVVAAATGAAALAEFRTAGGTVVISGLTVGTSGTNVVLGTTAIAAGDIVNITSGSITHG
jgi:hypothetical protein